MNVRLAKSETATETRPGRFPSGVLSAGVKDHLVLVKFVAEKIPVQVSARRVPRRERSEPSTAATHGG